MSNPVLAQVWRGEIVESFHRGAFVVADAAGRVVHAGGDIDRPVYARSAVKGLQALPLDHPLCGGGGTDNRVAIYSDRYPEQPLVVQGPGAGAEVTAAALLDDVLAIGA